MERKFALEQKQSLCFVEAWCQPKFCDLKLGIMADSQKDLKELRPVWISE